ncbi:MAG TPA: ElyC/SanA/YdcF family protein [Spirochaetota bacterium]|nr:ElyC/SanA/YdcF family protein [Spirochaetota bacterium]
MISKSFKVPVIILMPVFFVILFLWFTPNLFSYEERIYVSADAASSYDLIVLFGARVYSDGELSPVVRQRADAACLLFMKMNAPILVSGNGMHEVDSISKYLISKNIPSEFIKKDYSGCDTHDTLRTLERYRNEKMTAVSQLFHLYRIIDMARDHGVDVYGFAADKAVQYEENISFHEKLYVRVQRRFRNSLLFWIYRMNLYDSVSSLYNG